MNTYLLILALATIAFACSENQYEATITRHYTSYAGEESFIIRKGDLTTGETVFTMAGTSSLSNTDVYATVCLEATYYSVEYIDSYGDGWGSSTYGISYILIQIGGVSIFRGGLIYQSGTALKSGSGSFTVSLVSNPTSVWKYTDVPQSSSSWANSGYDDSAWTTAISGSFPAYTATTRYYRFTGSIANRDLVASIQSSINTTYGFAFYVQGTEAYRYHLPTGTLTGSTVSTATDGTYFVAVGANKFLLPTSGAFVLAYEVHLVAGVTSGSDPFTSVSSLLGPTTEGDYGYNKFILGTVVATPEGSSSTYYGSKAFNEVPAGYYYVSTTSTAVLTYTFPNGRAEWLNYYSITASSTTTYGYPSGWKVYGSNDGTTWATIDIQDGVTFTAVKEMKYFSIRANTKSYNTYKLELTSTTISGKSCIGDFLGYTTYFQAPASGLSYSATSISGYVGIDPVSVAPTINGYSQFTISPSLPSGLTLSTTSGSIIGTPNAVTSTTYTISAISYLDQSSSSATITLNYVLCSPPSHITARFMKVSLSYANEESYTVVDSAGTSYSSPTFVSSSTQYMFYCFPSGIITVSLADSYGDGWTTNSRLHIQLYDYVSDYYDIASIYERVTGVNVFNYDLSYKIPPLSTTAWTYSTSIVPNWYATATPAGFNSFDATNPPASNNNYIWLFRATATLTPTNYDGFELRVKARAGYVIYINGVEFFRKNLPAGDITAATTASGGDTSTTYRFISGPNSVFISGSNTVAIGIVNLSGNNPSTLLFDATLQQIMPNDIGRTTTVTITANPTGDNLSYINDLDYTTYWSVNLGTKQDASVTYSFGTGRAEHINKHCVTSATLLSAYDPSDWGIYGSTDDVTFELLGNVTNAYFSDTGVTRCFYLPDNKKAYNTYKMVISENAVPTASPYQIAIAELTLSMTDLDQLVIPTLTFDSSSYTGYIGVPFPEVTPSSDLYTAYTISPPLSLPLEIDTSTGSIRGTPIATMSRTLYTITAKNPLGVVSTVQVYLAVESCTYPNTQFSVLIQSGNAGNEMGFTLKNSNGETLLTKSKFTNTQANYYPQCRGSGVYSLVLTDSGGDGWDVGYFRVVLEDETIVLYGSLGNNESTKTFSFYIGYLITPLRSSYQYLNSVAEPLSDWKSITSTAAASWSTTTPGNFGNAVGVTQYFRKTFTIDNIANYASLVYNIKTKYGYIAYVNGEEIGRNNMPRSTITASTTCQVVRSEAMYTGSSISVQYSSLIQGTNVFAVEVHVYDSTASSSIDFDSNVQLTSEGSYRLLDGSASSDLATDDSISKIFDNVKGSVYVSGPRCIGAAPQWTYNNDRKEYITSYSVITGPNCNVRHPSGWRIEGSNDGRRWSVLHVVSKHTFTEYGVEETFNFYNSKVYNQYRMYVTECSNTGITAASEADCNYSTDNYGFQLAELSLYAKRLTAACEPTSDGYGGALDGDYAYKDCDTYYQGRVQALCTGGVLGAPTSSCSVMAIASITYPSDYMTAQQKSDFNFVPTVAGAEYTCEISPSLPTGVNFNAKTGAISGNSKEIISVASYTVTCTNSVGSVSTRVSFAITEKTGLDLWVWIVLGVFALIIILVLVLCIMNRMKSRKGSKGGHANLDKKLSSKAKSASKKTTGDNTAKAIKV